MSKQITPFELAVPQKILDDLNSRLALTRWPEQQTSADEWQQGVPLERAKQLMDYWKNQYDWRRCEKKLNSFGQFKTSIDGLNIHFIHARSSHPNALPLLITHGWPGSVIEFHKIIEPLIDPVAFGGKAEDAFHVVAPSLPGYGFSDKPKTNGWGVGRIATAWIELMSRLGYQGYVAQGGDWGSAVTIALAKINPDSLVGIHLNMVTAAPEPGESISDQDKAALAALEIFHQAESAYAMLHATRPQTIGYSLADSPVGQATWIYEKFQRWSDCNGDPETVLSRDEILDNIMLYWLNNAGASSARLYWESFVSAFSPTKLDLPVGCSIFPHEIVRPARQWVERIYSNLIYWNEPECGGHFAAFEQPDIFVEELRNCFRSLR